MPTFDDRRLNVVANSHGFILPECKTASYAETALKDYYGASTS